jgi:SAM-dependent methyltransferase
MLELIRDHIALPFIKGVNRQLRWIAHAGHRAQMKLEWGIGLHPDWFDHFIDLHDWSRTRNPLPWERGIFNLLAIRPGAEVLELCCGDGFNAHHFYSIRASRILAVDFTPQAIRHAQSHFGGSNITYEILDIRNGLPEGSYDNVVWDAGINHFSAEQCERLLVQIKQRLKPGGVLSGYEIAADGSRKHRSHERRFATAQELQAVLQPHFTNCICWETQYPSRRNFYFIASDATLQLPFAPSA